jgi:hypothetical protein
MADPDAAFASPGSSARQRMGRKRFYRLTEPGERALFVKVFQTRSGAARLLSWLRPSKAWREAAVASQIRARGFAVALPVAVGEQRRAGLLLRSFSVIEERPAQDLRALLGERALEASTRRSWIESFGSLNRRLHDAGVDQDDTSPNNFLVSRESAEDPWILIDFERCSLGEPLRVHRRWRLLAKLHRHDLGVSRSDRLRFLRSYLGQGCGRQQRRAAWLKIRVEFSRSCVRTARHAARGAFQVGRHVAREGSAWVVRGRESAEVLRLPLRGRAARQAWVHAHQLERLGLPALRPARLDVRGVALVAPQAARAMTPVERERAFERARRRFEGYGRFLREPEWILSGDRALLRDPRSFRLSRTLPVQRHRVPEAGRPSDVPRSAAD